MFSYLQKYHPNCLSCKFQFSLKGASWYCVCAYHALCVHRFTGFYSLTTQPRQLMAVVYHHTLVKLHVTPSTIGCCGKNIVSNISNMYNFYTIINFNSFFWFTSLYRCNMCIFIMWSMKLHCFPPNQQAFPQATPWSVPIYISYLYQLCWIFILLSWCSTFKVGKPCWTWFNCVQCAVLCVSA